MPHRKSPALLRFFLVKEQASPNDPSWLPRAESTTQGATDSYCYLCCNPASRTQTCTHARTQKHHTHHNDTCIAVRVFCHCNFCIFSLAYFTHQFHLSLEAAMANREYWRICPCLSAACSTKWKASPQQPRSKVAALSKRFNRSPVSAGATVSHLAGLILERSTTVYEPNTRNESGKTVKLVTERCSTVYTSKPRMNATWKTTTWAVLEGSSLVSVVAESCKVLLEHLLTQRWCAQILLKNNHGLLIAINQLETPSPALRSILYSCFML